MRSAAGWFLLALSSFGSLFLLAAPASAQTFPISQSVLDVDPGNTVATGQAFRYRINYRCNSVAANCEGVTVTWQMPPELRFVAALGTGDVASIANPGVGNNGPVTFTFNDPVAAGNTGDLDITVRFPVGSTPDGTITTGTTDNATASGTNLPDAMSTAPDVTAVAAPDIELQKTLQGLSFLDRDTTYRIRVRPRNANGSLNLTGVTVVDQLPSGAQFVSATNGGVYDMGTETVTWDNGGAGFTINVPSTLDLFVTVIYPTPTFTAGQVVTNTADGTATPLGEPQQGIGPDSATHPVDEFVESPSADVGKNLGNGFPSPALGQDFVYDVILLNNGNIALDSMVAVDTLPIEVDVTQVTSGSYDEGYAGLITIEYQTNLSPFALLGSNAGNSNTTYPIPALGAGEYVTELRWSFAGPIPPGTSPINGTNRAKVFATLLPVDNAGNPVAAGDPIENCVVIDWTATLFDMSPAAGSDSVCQSFSVSGPFSYSSPRKVETTSGPYIPGQTVGFRLDIDNQSQASDPLPNPVVVDLLPEFVSYVDASFTYDANGTGIPTPVLEEIENFQNSGRTLLRFRFTGSIQPGEEVRISFNTLVEDGIVAGTQSNTVGVTHNDPGVLVRCNGSNTTDSRDLDDDGDTSDRLCTDGETFTIASVAQLESEKLVRGQCDTDFTKFPEFGVTVRGGAIDYRLRVTNTGSVPVDDIVLIDILPFVGDTGVLDLTPRETGWRPLLVEPIRPVAGATIFYSTSGNPCRPEVGGPTSGCDAPNWSTVPPEPITAAQSFKVEFGPRVLEPLDTLDFQLAMIAPSDAPITADVMNPLPGDIAWNSFGFGVERVDGGSLNAEPLKVGIVVKPEADNTLGDLVFLDTDGDGTQNDGPTGVDNVPVQLWQPGLDGVPGSGDDVLVLTSITAPDLGGAAGWYEFNNLPDGDYFVCFVPPIGFEVTTQDAGGDETLDSDVDPTTNCTNVVSLGPNEVNPDLDLGLLPPELAAIGNYVWFDTNGDGVQNDPITSGVNGVLVELYLDDGDGIPEVGGDDGAPIETQSTMDDRFGAPGYYLFDELPPNQGYFVRFVLPPAATTFTGADAGGDDVVDSDADETTGLTPVVTLAPAEVNLTLDAGLVLDTGVLAIGDRVFCDDDNDGVFETDDGEEGVNGVSVSLYLDLDADGLPEDGEFVRRTLTQVLRGRVGSYSFDNLPAGDYIVTVDAINFEAGGALFGKRTSTGNDPAADPDDDVDFVDDGSETGTLTVAQPVTLTAGAEPTVEDGDDDTNLTVDFGFFETAPPAFDYGDAPDDTNGQLRGDYATRALDMGPFHELVDGGPFLGACVDSDTGSAQSVGANADDVAASLGLTEGVCAVANDDEDGAVFADLSLEPSQVSSVDVTVGPLADCRVDAWIDFDRNGVFDPADQIATDQVIGAATSTAVGFTVPVTAVPGVTYARFRCSSAGGLPPTGGAADGEVEDYVLTIVGQDLGDAPDVYDTLVGSGGPLHRVDPATSLYLGACVDLEADGVPSATALGDDAARGEPIVGAACADDEDGVTLPDPLFACEAGTVTVNANAAGVLDAWIDFGADGSFDPTDRIANGQAVVAGPNAIAYTAPCAAVAGVTYARFRLSSAGVAGPTGLAVDGEVEDYAVTIAQNDFGDAPDSYTTRFASGGPYHGVDTSGPLFLGACVDTEAEGQDGPSADSDDLSAGGTSGTCTVANDDEDGVAFGMLFACQTTSLTVTASAAGTLDAWIDFAGDGTFTQLGDRVATGVAVSAGANVVTVPVPCGATLGNTYSRFRLSTAGVSTPGGRAADGEVEDYLVTIKGSDLGDAPDSYDTTLAEGGPIHGVDPNGGPFLGACVDTENDAQAPLDATGDDLGAGTSTLGTCATANDDEDGVTFDSMIAACATDAEVTVTASTAGVLDAWIDFDGDGTFTELGDQIFTGRALAVGANPITFSVPCSADTVSTFARFRFSSTGVASPGGPVMDGEVEDYAVDVKGADFGDAPDTYTTTLASGGPFHTADPTAFLFLGSCVDTEGDAEIPLLATGDDATVGASFLGLGGCVDDEDGIVLPEIVACQNATIEITASADGFIDAWIDFDADGTFAEAGDQIFASQMVSAGTNSLQIAVPCDASADTTYARFRLSSVGGLPIGGGATDGEVEDYLVGQLDVDLADAPDTYGTTAAAGGPTHPLDPMAPLYLGACVDSENDGQPTIGADGDDLGVGDTTIGTCAAANDDEDGVTFDQPLVACALADLTITANAPGMVDGWIDFGADGTFAEPGDRALVAIPVLAGPNPVQVAVPCDAVPGATYARFRITRAGGIGPGGPAVDGEVEDYAVELLGSDLGDAPDTYGTTTAANGPLHTIPTGATLFLGTCVDGDIDGQPSAGVDGDDLGVGTTTEGACAVANDDEDGVVYSGPVIACLSNDVTVTASEAGLLDAWIDFDGDGVFQDLTERIATSLALVAGTNTVTFTAPCDAVAGATVSRFRVSTAGGLGPITLDGTPALDGEVEDHPLTVAGLDYGDAPDPTYPTLLASDGARHVVLPADNPTLGGSVDTEIDGQPSPNHDGDDTNGVDDEDGVTFQAVLIPGTDGFVDLQGGTTGGLVSAWVDFNGDGDWDDAGEQVLTDFALGAGATVTETFPVPVGSPDGSTCARVRISSGGGLTPTGLATDGEVEDNLIAVGVEEPAIGVAKEVLAIDNEDDGIFLVTFGMSIENFGNVPLDEIGLQADLADAFEPAAGFEIVSVFSSDFALNGGFDGELDIELLDTGNALEVGASGGVELVIRVDTGFEAGPYTCTAIGTGTSPDGEEVDDESNDGDDPDPDNDGDASDDDEPTVLIFDVNVLDIPTLGTVGAAAFALLLLLAAAGRLRRDGAV